MQCKINRLHNKVLSAFLLLTPVDILWITKFYLKAFSEEILDVLRVIYYFWVNYSFNFQRTPKDKYS